MRKNNVLALVIAIVLSVASFVQPVFAEKEVNAKFEEGNEYFGFKCEEIIEVEDQDDIFYTFTHVKTGAELLWQKNSDTHRAFAVNFKTPPENNKGIPHIIEHSVLRGSEKYPFKNTYSLLNSYSYANFVNAYTHLLYTSFPISSTNETDLYNCMKVYLDGMFAPRFLEDERIFKQEAIRKEILNEEDPIVYNGIVYNEMKGDERTPSRKILTGVNSVLYPDTPYRYDSAGKTEYIKHVTYEETKEYYHKYYHPSNAMFFFYGDLDMFTYLEYINNEYLVEYDKRESVVIEKQEEAGAMLEGEIEYSIPMGETTENKTFLSLNYMLDDFGDHERDLGLMLIANVLMLDESPLRNALVDAGFDDNLSVVYGNDYIQPRFEILLSGTDEDKKDLFVGIVEDTLENFVVEGMDREVSKEFVDLLIDNLELNSYQETTDSWLTNLQTVATNWLAEKPLYHGFELSYDIIDEIRAKIDDGYFEELIEEYLLNCNHTGFVVFKPVSGLQEEKDLADRKELEEYKESLSEEELEELIIENIELLNWYNTPDDEELLKTFPTLTMEDIDTSEIRRTEVNEESIEDIKIVYTPSDMGEIAYTDMYFDTTRVPQDNLEYLFLLDKLLGNVSTENYSYNELRKNELRLTDGIDFGVYAIEDAKDPDKYYPKFDVSFYNLIGNLSDTMDLVNEIIYNSKFDEIERIKDIVAAQKNSMKNRNPVNYVYRRVLAYNSKASLYNEITGIDYYDFLCKVEKLLETNPETVIAKLEETYRLAFPKQDLIIGITCSENNYSLYKEEIERVAEVALKPVEAEKITYNLEEHQKNEGFMDDTSVQFVAKGHNLNESLDYEYNGKFIVLDNIVNDFVFNAMRMSGAYGGQFRIERNGNMILISWDDPNLKETLLLYDYTSMFLEDLYLTEEQMENYIIGSVGNYLSVSTSRSRGWGAQNAYISNSDTSAVQVVEEILSTTLEDIREFSILFEQLAQEGNYCVWGSEEKITEHSDLFEKVIKAFEEKDGLDEKTEEPSDNEPKSTPRPQSKNSSVVPKTTPTPTPTPTPEPTPEEIEEPEEEKPALSTGEYKAYIKGYSDGLFRPERHITRAEAAVILANILKAEDLGNYGENIAYTDVDESHWAAEAILLVSDKELFKGYDDGSFKPDQNITRAEFSTVTFKLLQTLKEISTSEITDFRFEDTKGHWAQDYIEHLADTGSIKGYSDGTFRPENMINRAESVTLINRILEIEPLYEGNQIFEDVDSSHWAFYDINSAALD
ncbi:S-layer homology domain-containing protein [Herbivorax sp. ANBcel31]|uniref:S-layer homology domain-containing protein n=1 Tax=Herbivorax sp. ANBcel31 TaxID=3069754 RepID=UPI0027B4C9D5|nr:S-layer homology domain-containing protein [Herbivorax sp. ANBcel31]MDQ2087313.1 S-layer homology domain-containing protein [Herbivorax sp. ANBcel31]